MSTQDHRDDYEIGYGKPPKHSRFRPGQSGNRKGRPKGTKNFKTDVKDILSSKVRVTRDGSRRKLSTQEAMLLRLREKALRGDARALDRLIDLARTFNNEELAETAGLTVNDAALLEIYRKRVVSGAAGPADTAEASAQDHGDLPSEGSIDPEPGDDDGKKSRPRAKLKRRRLKHTRRRKE